jgi:mono/diheme cytochrome c family protein
MCRTEELRAMIRTSTLLLLLLTALAGCRQDMHDAPRYDALEGSVFFADGRSARPLVEGTVARGRLQADDHLYRGLVDGEPAPTFPFELSRDDLERGRERFGIFCAPCHDRTGSGNGMIVQRGFKRPPSYHIERLREATPGYLFDVITRGYGAMYGLADRVPAEDRWRIVGWIRVLQRSQRGTLQDVPPEARAALQAEGAR